MRIEPPIDPALIAEHNRGIWQARAVYYSQPISSPSYRCRRRTCPDYGYERGGLCCACDKAERAKNAARYQAYRERQAKEGAA